MSYAFAYSNLRGIQCLSVKKIYIPQGSQSLFYRVTWARMSTIATAASLDHLVLTVKDLDASIAFYEKYLGMKHTSFTSGGVPRHALSFGPQKINLHVSGKEFEPKARNVQPGSGDLCFLVQDKVDDVLDRLTTDGIQVLEGGKVVDRTGARGKIRSVYIRDPDGNLIEYVDIPSSEL